MFNRLNGFRIGACFHDFFREGKRVRQIIVKVILVRLLWEIRDEALRQNAHCRHFVEKILKKLVIGLKNGVEFPALLCDNKNAGFFCPCLTLCVMKRSAFTLVELLVVIAVVVILVAILIPAVNAAREHARRNQCLAQQRALAIAMVDYAQANNGLPGSLNQLGETPIRSWVVSILPMIGENRRYEIMMRHPLTPAEVDQATVPLPALLCPSDRPEGNARLNYVVNCGPAAWSPAINGDIAPHFTLFKDRRRLPDDLTSINRRVRIEEIPDGASNTILLSENVNAGFWHQGTADDPNELPTPSGVFTRDSVAVANFGFIWADQAALAPNSSTAGPRPSSRHPGTIVAAFADGSARVINDNIGIWEWLKLVCPDDAQARKSISQRGFCICPPLPTPCLCGWRNL